MKSPSTAAIRLLEAHGITYRLLPHAEPVFTVEAAARQRGVPVEEMVKSILLRDKVGHHVLACVLGHARVRPQAVRLLMPDDWRRLSFADGDEITAITGYVQGAVAPLGLPQNVPVIFDSAIARCDTVNISSGDPMAGLELNAADLVDAVKPIIADIA